MWTIQFRLSFKGHKSLEYCCLVIHLTSVSIISYAESNGGIFVLIGRIKPEIWRSKKSIVRVRDHLARKPSSKKGIRKTWKDYFERLVFQKPWIVETEIDFPSINTTFYAYSNSGIFVLVLRIKPEIKPSKQSALRGQD